MAEHGAQERDHRLLRRIARGDRGAFEELYHRYHRRLFGYVFKVTRRQELVDEVLDDTLLAVWQGAASFSGRSRPSTWIFGIAYRKSLKALRALPRERGQDAYATGAEPPEPDDLPAPPDGPESLMVRRELGSALGRALAELPPEQRAVVELTYAHGCSYREIAEIVGCPVNTVKTRMFHARRRLRELLPKLGFSDGRVGTR